MIPVDQTIFHTETTKGNCLAANIASVLEIDIAVVPNFAEFIRWEDHLQKWLTDNHKLRYVEFAIAENTRFALEWSKCYHLIHGPSPRGSFWHSVVGFEGKMVHDPHPDKTGLKEEKTFVVFVRS